nr:hypothetical protein [Tanacetum cinerariifolium]
GAWATGAAPRIKSIWNSTWQTGERPGRSLGKTSRNSLTIDSSCIKELICRVLGLLVPLLELNQFGILLGKLGKGQVVSSVIGGILSIKARDMDTKLLSALESNNTLSRCWFRRNVPVTTFESCSSEMTHLVASLTLDGTRSCVMQVAFLTQRKVSSIPIVFNWGGSLSPKGFLPSIMFLVVIIVAVVIVVEGNPPMKTSMSFLEFGIIVGHTTANSYNLLIFLKFGLGDLVGFLYSNRLGE